jgi:hypothetical protein
MQAAKNAAVNRTSAATTWGNNFMKQKYNKK